MKVHGFMMILSKLTMLINDVIPQEFGGPHLWWNMHPLEFGKHHDAQGPIAFNAVHNSIEQESRISRRGGGLLNQTKTMNSQSLSSTSQGARYEVEDKVTAVSESGDISLTQVSIHSATKTPSRLQAPQGRVHLKAGVNTSTASSSNNSSSILWQSSEQQVERHKTYSPCQFNAPLEIVSKETIIQLVQGQPQAFLELLQQQGGPLIQQALQEEHYREHHENSGPSAALTAVIALGVTIATSGWAASLAGSTLSLTGTQAAMAASGIKALCAQSVIALVSHRGDMAAAVRDLTTRQSMVTALEAMAIAGVLDSLGLAGAQTTLLGHAQVAVSQAAVHGAVDLTVRHRSLDDVLRQSLKSIAVNTAGGYAANQIGAAYKGENPDLNWFSHKAAHAALGALIGAAISDNSKEGMVAGALGAATAEIVSEELTKYIQENSHSLAQEIKQKHHGGPIDFGNVKKSFNEVVERNGNIGRLSAATIALVLGQDVPSAIHAATNAIENNNNSRFKAFIAIEVLQTLFVELPMVIELLRLHQQGDVDKAIDHLVKQEHIQRTSQRYCFNSDFYRTAQEVWAAYIYTNELIFIIAQPLIKLSERTVNDYLQEQYEKYIKPQQNSNSSEQAPSSTSASASSAMPPHDPDHEPEEKDKNKNYDIQTKNFNLNDGDYLTQDKALDAAIEFLDKGYKDMGNGRFLSQDGLRQVRMGDSDLRGLHAGGRHINFEFLKINPIRVTKYIVDKNVHIFLK